MSTEKRNFRLKIHLACGTDELRPVMQHVYFDNGFMIATDSHILVKAAVQHFSDFDKTEVDALNGKMLHKDTFKKILSCKQVIITENGIQDLATKDVYAFAPEGLKYPNYEVAIPKEKKQIDEIGFNPYTCAKLMKVLANNQIYQVKAEFQGAGRAIKLVGTGENNGTLEAVLMPVLLNN